MTTLPHVHDLIEVAASIAREHAHCQHATARRLTHEHQIRTLALEHAALCERVAAALPEHPALTPRAGLLASLLVSCEPRRVASHARAAAVASLETLLALVGER